MANFHISAALINSVSWFSESTMAS